MRFGKLALFIVLAIGMPLTGAFADEADSGSPPAAPAAEEMQPEAAPVAETAEAPAASEVAADAEPVPASPDEAAALEEAPETAAASENPPAAPAESAAARSETVLGPAGRDAQGRVGRIHVVATGDTLWEISDAYLGTPWVWPSIWNDNGEIENPHLIYPNDRIWITPSEMRKVTAEEAAELMAGGADDGSFPAAMEPPDAMPDTDLTRPTYRYTENQTTGFVSKEDFDGAFTIVDSQVPRIWLGDKDSVIIGTSDVVVGDQFEIFRRGDRMVDPDTGILFGYATDELGWLEVTKIHGDTATAMIKLSSSEIQRGDHLLPRQPRPLDIEIGFAPDVEGRVLGTPAHRQEMGSTDVVYLNRGTAHGLEVGSPLEVYRPLGTARDELRKEQVGLPDEVVAKLLVVSARDDTAVAVVVHTTGELERGDRFRGADEE